MAAKRRSIDFFRSLLGFRGSTLIGTNFSNLGGPTTVYSINTSTAAATSVTSFQQGPVRAMAVLNTNTVDVASDSPVSQSLVQVNLSTGIPTSLGQLPSSGAALIAALSLGTDGNLYALDPAGNDFLISSNGAGTLIGNTGGQYWLDATMASTVLDPASSTTTRSAASYSGAPAPLLGSGLSGLVSGLAVALFLLTGRAKLRWNRRRA